MNWNDNAIILSKIAHGENAHIVTVMSEHRGKWAGFLASANHSSGKNAYSRRANVECGDFVDCHWRSRIQENLGTMKLEIKKQPFAYVFNSKAKLLLIKHASDLCASLCPERQFIGGVYQSLSNVIESSKTDVWSIYLIKFELEILKYLGYGLDLSKCAVTGVETNLAYVSPKTGRAVSQTVGEPYKEKLLKLPEPLSYDDVAGIKWVQIFDYLNLTGYFLNKIFHSYSKNPPKSRDMLLQALNKDCKNMVDSPITDT